MNCREVMGTLRSSIYGILGPENGRPVVRGGGYSTGRIYIRPVNVHAGANRHKSYEVMIHMVNRIRQAGVVV
jgi:hypothetical protein